MLSVRAYFYNPNMPNVAQENYTYIIISHTHIYSGPHPLILNTFDVTRRPLQQSRCEVCHLALYRPKYGDGAGNTAEETSSVFSLIRMC